jgi:hypothetical protein
MTIKTKTKTLNNPKEHQKKATNHVLCTITTCK